MKNAYFAKTSALATGAIMLPMASVVWLTTVPGMMSATTFTAVSLIGIGAAYVALNTFRNSQATETVASVLQRAEAGPSRTSNR